MNSGPKRLPRIWQYLAVMGCAYMTCWQGSALAHHSFAAYDQAVTKSVIGTLKEFNWNAPHSEITVAYMDEKGQVQEVSVTTVTGETTIRTTIESDCGPADNTLTQPGLRD